MEKKLKVKTVLIEMDKPRLGMLKVRKLEKLGWSVDLKTQSSNWKYQVYVLTK